MSMMVLIMSLCFILRVTEILYKSIVRESESRWLIISHLAGVMHERILISSRGSSSSFSKDCFYFLLLKYSGLKNRNTKPRWKLIGIAHPKNSNIVRKEILKLMGF